MSSVSENGTTKPWKSVRFWIAVAIGLRFASPTAIHAWQQAAGAQTFSEWARAGLFALAALLIAAAVPAAIRWLGHFPTKPWKSVRFWICVALGLLLANHNAYHAWQQAARAQTFSEWAGAGLLALAALLIAAVVPAVIRWLGRW